MKAQADLLSAFVSWASAQQRELLDSKSSFVTTLKVGRATPKRAVSFAVERFIVEPTGWIGNTLEEGGDLIVWESGEADAAWAHPSDLKESNMEPSYFEHWDSLTPPDFEVAFAPFIGKFIKQPS